MSTKISCCVTIYNLMMYLLIEHYDVYQTTKVYLRVATVTYLNQLMKRPKNRREKEYEKDN